MIQQTPDKAVTDAKVLGTGFKRKFGCPKCRLEPEAEKDCFCDNYCGSEQCSWRIIRRVLNSGIVEIGPSRVLDKRSPAASATLPKPSLPSGNTPVPSSTGLSPVDSSSASEAANTSPSLSRPPAALLEDTGRESTPGRTSHGTSRGSAQLPTGAIKDSAENRNRITSMSNEYRSRIQYPSFPENVKLEPGVWDRKGEPPGWKADPNPVQKTLKKKVGLEKWE